MLGTWPSCKPLPTGEPRPAMAPLLATTLSLACSGGAGMPTQLETSTLLARWAFQLHSCCCLFVVLQAAWTDVQNFVIVPVIRHNPTHGICQSLMQALRDVTPHTRKFCPAGLMNYKMPGPLESCCIPWTPRQPALRVLSGMLPSCFVWSLGASGS